MEEKGLLTVSFGTSFPEALARCIVPTEGAIAAALPDRRPYRAFTSGMILRKLARRDGVVIDDVPAALGRMLADGVRDVVIQPTHIMNGDEFDKLRAQAGPWRDKFRRLAVGAPLLTSIGDYRDAAHALLAQLPPLADDQALVLMGHGTGHHANAAYAALEYQLHDMGRGRIFLGTVEGYPTLAEVRRRLAEHPAVRRVLLAPFMLVAGDHAQNDMAGPGPDSWRSILAGDGYAVSCRMAGLGEYPGIRAILAAHARAADSERSAVD